MEFEIKPWSDLFYQVAIQIDREEALIIRYRAYFIHPIPHANDPDFMRCHSEYIGRGYFVKLVFFLGAPFAVSSSVERITYVRSYRTCLSS